MTKDEVAKHLPDYVSDRHVSPGRIADGLRTTKSEIAQTLGLGRDALLRTARVRAVRTKTRLREMLEILNRVEPQAGSPLAAYAWFRSEPLPGFGNRTPDQLVRDGEASKLHAYLDRIAAGGFA